MGLASGRSRVELVQRQMEAQMLEGHWRPGNRLPSERDLALQWGVSRATVREAISRLAARNLLVSRHGSGVFVTDQLQAGFTSPWRQLLADHPELRWDTLEFRRELEGAAAQFAAQRATREDLKAIGAVVKRLTRAYEEGNKAEEAHADADFHEAIAEASHNSMFRHLHTGVIRMLRAHIALNLDGMQDGSAETAEALAQHLAAEHIALNMDQMEEIGVDITACLMQQHLAIWDAIRNRQPEQARAAMRAHIDFTWNELKRRDELLSAARKTTGSGRRTK
jgi:GntR family transcriptional repressor for pyruvate dehydrogenase complex